MKTLIVALFVLAIVVPPVFGGDEQISDQSLEKIGLGDMAQLSDEEGATIRAKFFHSFTFSYVSVNNIQQMDFGHHFAHTNLSVGGASAGGFSFAW